MSSDGFTNVQVQRDIDSATRLGSQLHVMAVTTHPRSSQSSRGSQMRREAHRTSSSWNVPTFPGDQSGAPLHPAIRSKNRTFPKITPRPATSASVSVGADAGRDAAEPLRGGGYSPGPAATCIRGSTSR
jgi:hypothetical protein